MSLYKVRRFCPAGSRPDCFEVYNTSTGRGASFGMRKREAERTARMMNAPETYLSRSEGRFRVIHKSMPVSPDKGTADEALAAAERRGICVPGLVFWDGDAGFFSTEAP